MLQGQQTWVFKTKPVIIGRAAIGGPFEAQGNLADDFDILHSDIWLGQASYEQAEKRLLEQACEVAIKKSGLQKADIQFFFSGDLINQIVPSSFTARTLGIPFFGIYGACSSAIEGLSLASLLVDSGFAQNVLVGTSSHNASAEKQYRYPTEYGAQKPPTAQWTVTGAGAAVVSDKGVGPRVVAATIGRIIDMGLSDPFNMGAAMAPAAVDTLAAHFRDVNIAPTEYDLIVTGDLGKVGHFIASDLLVQHKLAIPQAKFTDCGILMYKEDQQVFAGGSGCACVATATFGHLMNRMIQGELKRILVVATGALLSPLSYQQKETIPCIAYAASIEV